jgi:hypothetical protein
VELGRHEADIRKLGYGVAALSYDSPEALAHFARRKDLRFPLLSDPESKVIDAFGIRNTAIAEGFAKGTPRPGLFLLNAKGRVEGKYFEEDYRERITVSSILTGRFGERAVPAGDTAVRARIRVTPAASATVIRTRTGPARLRARRASGVHPRLLDAICGPRLDRRRTRVAGGGANPVVRRR